MVSYLKWIVLSILVPACAFGKTFTVTWSPSSTPNVEYRVYVGIGTAAPVVIKTLTATTTSVELTTDTYVIYVKAVVVGTTVESDPSNAWRIPTPAGVVQGVDIGLGQQ